MKLASFRKKSAENGTFRIGLVEEDSLVDLLEADPNLPKDMISLLEAGDSAFEAVKHAATTTPSRIRLDDVELGPPVPNPGKVLAIGLNYADHVKETGRDLPKHQIWFNKQRNCINGPHGTINLPKVSTDFLDYEGELCYVIGRRCKHVPDNRAHEVIAGFCIGNDVSVRDWQRRVPTMQIGKSFDTHGPTGPWLTTPDEVGDPHKLDLKTWVNGELHQNSNTQHMIFNCYEQIAHLSQVFTLDVGDIIFTGTPDGVGHAMTPPGLLKAGDTVRIEIEKLGAIENTVVPEKAETVI